MNKFRKPLAVLAAVVMVGAFFTGCGNGSNNRGDLTVVHDGGDWDVIVVGTGVAGMWAAHALVEGDPELRVLVLEQNGEPGANSRWTGAPGNIAAGWQAATYNNNLETFRTQIQAWQTGGGGPNADATALTDPSNIAFRDTSITRYPNVERLWHIVERAATINEWTTAHLAVMPGWATFGSFSDSTAQFNSGRRMDDLRAWFERSDAEHNGEMRFWSRATKLLQNETTGEITGVRFTALTPETSQVIRTYDATADFIIMATGSANKIPEQLSRFSNAVPGVQDIPVGLEHYFVGYPFRTNPNDGKGIFMLEDAGAELHPAWFIGSPIHPSVHPSLFALPTYGRAFGVAVGTNWHTPMTHSAGIIGRTIVVDSQGRRLRGETAFSNAAATAWMATNSPSYFWMIFSGDVAPEDWTWEVPHLTTGTPPAVIPGTESVSLNLRNALTAAATSTGIGQYVYANRARRFSDEVKMHTTLAGLAAEMGLTEAQANAFVAMVAEYDAAVVAALGYQDGPEDGWVDPLAALNDPDPTTPTKLPGTDGANLRRFSEAHGPFFAVRFYPRGSEIAGGVRTNVHGQVLSTAGAEGTLLSTGNVYAVGGVSNREFWGVAYGAGLPLSLAAGWIAAQHVLYQLSE